VGRLLEAAHELGCKFDGWGEHFKFQKWIEAAERTGIDMDAYNRKRDLKEELPWDHVDCMVDKQYFVDEYWRSRLALLAEDCRQVKCHQCGVIEDDQDGCLTMLRTSREGQKKEATWQRQSSPERPQTTAVQKIRFRFAKQGALRFLSHLETMRALTRALRRAAIPVQHSQGFHPQPLLNFATALPVGVESTAEYGDVTLFAALDPGVFQARLNAVLPDSLRMLEASAVPLNATSLMSEPLAAQYSVELPAALLPDDGTSLPSRVRALLACGDISMPRWHKKGPRQVNIRPGVVRLNVMPMVGDTVTFNMLVREDAEAKAKPQEVMCALLALQDDDLPSLHIYKHEAFVRDGADFIPVMERHAPEAQEVHV
jgi:radical SAM-linked protein